jgi:hypothetical protein
MESGGSDEVVKTIAQEMTPKLIVDKNWETATMQKLEGLRMQKRTLDRQVQHAKNCLQIKQG